MRTSRQGTLFGAGVLYWIVVALHALVFWSLPFFPSQDGPAHLESAAIASDLIQGSSQVLAQTYVLSPEPLPNLTTHWLLVGLLQMASPAVAEKTVLTLYCLLFAASVPFVLAAFSRQATGLSALCLPFLGNYLLHQGFYNFSLGTGMGLVAVGVWARWTKSRGWGSVATLAALFVALYFTHLAALALTVIVIGVLTIWWVLRDLRADEGARGRVVPSVLALGTALIPVAPLAMWFRFHAAGGPMASLPAAILARLLFTLDVLVSYRIEEAVLAALFALVVWIALVAAMPRLWRQGGRELADGLLLASIALGLAVFIVPNRLAGGSWMSHRLALWAALMAALWLATRYRGHAGRRILWSTGLLVAMGLLGLRSVSYLVLSAEVREVVALGKGLETGEVLLPIVFAPRGRGDQGELLSVKTKALLHVAGHLAARDGIINLGNYQAPTGLFAVQLRGYVDPAVDLLLGIDGEPTTTEIEAAWRSVPDEVDVVLVTGLAPASSVGEAARTVLGGLGRTLRVGAVSSPRGSAILLVRPSPGSRAGREDRPG